MWIVKIKKSDPIYGLDVIPGQVPGSSDACILCVVVRLHTDIFVSETECVCATLCGAALASRSDYSSAQEGECLAAGCGAGGRDTVGKYL